MQSLLCVWEIKLPFKIYESENCGLRKCTLKHSLVSDIPNGFLLLPQFLNLIYMDNGNICMYALIFFLENNQTFDTGLQQPNILHFIEDC